MPKVQQNAPSAGRGRRGRSVRVSTSLAEINVVPLVDVMLVLLIIFMVAAPMMTQGMQVNLPQATKAPSPSAPKPIYVTVPADFGQGSTRADRQRRAFRVDILDGARAPGAARRATEKSVFVRADGAVTMQHSCTVIDRLKEAGVEKVGHRRPARTEAGRSDRARI